MCPAFTALCRQLQSTDPEHTYKYFPVRNPDLGASWTNITTMTCSWQGSSRLSPQDWDDCQPACDHYYLEEQNGNPHMFTWSAQHTAWLPQTRDDGWHTRIRIVLVGTQPEEDDHATVCVDIRQPRTEDLPCMASSDTA